MTEQPDTAAIRADAIALGHMEWTETVVALCDELDAVRAEADDANHEVMLERSRAEAAEENLSFAQQRAADNGLRAEIGERKIAELVSEVRALKARIDAALEVLAEEPDWNQGRNAEVIFFGRDVFEALTGQQ